MKKIILSLAFLFMFLFANANDKIVNKKYVKFNSISKDVKLSQKQIYIWCTTLTTRWYQYSYEGMDGSTYDVYEVVKTTTCYN